MKRVIICLLIVLSFFAKNYAQNEEHYPTVFVDDVEHYVYKVKKSEGFYRIGVVFGVSREEILEANPQLTTGLKLGEEILIPRKKGFPKLEEEKVNKEEEAGPAFTFDIIESSFSKKQPEEPLNSPRQMELPVSVQEEEKTEGAFLRKTGEPHYRYHKVKKDETLYSLSRKYEVKQEDIIEQNPTARMGIIIGEVLRIPKAEDLYVEKQIEKQKEDFSVKYLIHHVKEKETLFSVSKRYSVDIEDLIKANPDLQILQIGQELKVPYYAGLSLAETTKKDSKSVILWEDIFGQKKKKEAIRLAFLLPFDLDNPSKKTGSRFIEFYAGAIKAIQEESDFGTSLEIYTYDTGKTKQSIQDLIALNPNLSEVDLIIGPAYSEQVPIATEFAKTNEVAIVIPFSSKVEDIDSNPYVYQFNPAADSELAFFKVLFESRFKNMNYIFANVHKYSVLGDSLEMSSQIKKYLKEQERSFKEVNLFDLDRINSDSLFVYNRKNLIIFNTEQFSAVSPYLESLNIKDRRYDIVLLEKYSWKRQAHPRPVGLYIAPFKPEYQMKKLEEYDRNFEELFSWLPQNRSPRYDLLGYDLTRYFTQLLLEKRSPKEGDSEEDDSEEEQVLLPYSDGQQSDFQFKRSSEEGGFVNQKFYVGESQIE